ncbi:MAG: hypothetical protein ABI413_21860 [Ktedonobacteraceae bacterium]
MKTAIQNVLFMALLVLLGCVGIAGGGVALDWWMENGWGGSMEVSAAWSEFLLTLAILLICCFLSGLQPVIAYFWEAHSAVRAAREEEAECKAQSEFRRMLLLAEAQKARANRQKQILLAVAEGIEAWNTQWEQTHPEEARSLAAWLRETEQQQMAEGEDSSAFSLTEEGGQYA